MFCVFVIPDYIKAEDYFKISPIDEIRPFELITISEKLAQKAQSICFILKEITKNIKIDPQEIFNNNIFLLSEKKYLKKSFKDLINHIEDETSKILKELKASTGVECDQCNLEENFLFLDHFYCCINSDQCKDIEKILDLRTLIIVDRTKDKILYKIYCLKHEKEKMKSMILSKLGKNAVIESKNKIQSESDCMKLKELAVRSVENILLSVIYNGLAESLDKCGIDSFKYKLITQSKTEKEIKNLKKMNKDSDLDEILTIIDLSIV